MSPATAVPRPALRAGWRTFLALLLVAAAVGLGFGARESARLHAVRHGVLAGTSAQGEWAPLERYGYRLRLDGVAPLDEAGLPGLSVVAVRLTMSPAHLPQGQESLSCDVTVWTADGRRIIGSGPAPETGASTCYWGAGDVQLGREYPLTVVFQVPPRDVPGLVVEVSPTDLHPEAASLWENWRFTPRR